MGVGLRVATAQVPVTKVRGSGRDGRAMFIGLPMSMAAVGGRPWPGEVSEGTGRTRPCAYVFLWTLNFVID